MLAGLVFATHFAPAFDPGNAKAPKHHASLVGRIVVPHRAEGDFQIEVVGRVVRFAGGAEPAPGRVWSLYIYDQNGRLWGASYEWSHAEITGRSFAIPDEWWGLLPDDRVLLVRIRVVPDWSAGQRLADVAASGAVVLREPGR